MGFLNKIFSTDSSETKINSNEGSIITSLFNGFGKQNRVKAEKISALHSGIGLIADTIASLPVYKYKINADGSKTKVNCKENYLLNNSMNEKTNSYNGKNIMIKDSIFYGNGYILIERDKDFKITKLIPLQSDSVVMLTNDNGKYYYYQITLNGKTFRKEYYEVINLCNNSTDGVLGKGVLVYGSEVLGLALSQNNFQGAALENGAYSKGVLYAPANTNKEELQNLANRIRTSLSKGNSCGILTLPDNTKYEPISLSPSDLDLLKSQEFTIQEIARLLKIRPELLGSSISSGNYKNLEESNLQFLTYTLQPYLKNLEETLNHFLLTEVEKESGEYCFCFDLTPLTRTDIKTQSEVLDKMSSSGIMTVAEVRNTLNLPYIDGTETLMFSKFNTVLKDGKFTNLQSMSSEDGVSNTSKENE